MRSCAILLAALRERFALLIVLRNLLEGDMRLIDPIVLQDNF